MLKLQTNVVRNAKGVNVSNLNSINRNAVMHFIIIIFSLSVFISKCTTITQFADECSFSAIDVFLSGLFNSLG